MDCMMRITFLLLATFECQTDFVAAMLIMKPKDTDAKVNHSTYINCSTDHGPTAIFWFHGSKYVYTGNEILEPYHVRYAIDRKEWNGTYIYNLIINSVQPGDAGKYICAEDEGVGEQYAVQLVVLENNPTCESTRELDRVIGQNTCNVEPDEVEIHCTVTYHGNIPPNMEWKKVGESNSATLDASIITSGNGFVSTLKLKGDIGLNNSSFVCETRRATSNLIKCTSKILKVMYAVSDNSTVNKSVNEEIHCNANTSQSCNYKWKWLQDDDFTIESSTSVLKARKLGWHRCEAECHLRNQTCNLLVKRAMIYGDTESIQTRTITLYVVLSVVVTVIVVGVLIFVILWIIKRRGGFPTENDIVSSESLQHRNKLISPSIELTRAFTNGPNTKPEEIRAIATLDEELFILRLKQSFIEVYDSGTFDFKRRVAIKGGVWTNLRIIDPDDIASCSVKNCLYAFNKGFHSQDPSIIRFNPTTGNVISNWTKFETCRISVARDTNVILTSTFQLDEYTADGEIIREIRLDSGTGITRAWHAAKLNNGLFVVCHGAMSIWGDSTGRVCLLSTKIANIEMIRMRWTNRVDEVEILKEFGRVEGESINILGRPFYLSVDKEDTMLVLHESVNENRAVLISSNLEKPRIIVSKDHGMKSSRRACFNDSRGQWLVADYHRVMVCRVKDGEVEREIYDLPHGAQNEQDLQRSSEAFDNDNGSSFSVISLCLLRSLDRHDLFIPRARTSMAQTRAFAINGSSLWNQIGNFFLLLDPLY